MREIVVIAATAAILSVAAPANAGIVNGVCTLELTFSFPSAQPTLTGPASPYTFSTAGGSSGCTLDTLDPTPASVTGSAGAGLGGITNARCGVLVGNGPFNQTWGGIIPSVNDGTHVVAGTWLHATMAVSAFPNELIRFTGVIELIPTNATETATKMQDCVAGRDVDTIRFTGVEVFNDPVL